MPTLGAPRRGRSGKPRIRSGDSRTTGALAGAGLYDLGMEREPIAVATPAEWAEVCSESFVPLRVRSVEPSFRATLSHVELSSRVGVTRVASMSSEVYRSDRVIAREPRDDLLLSIHGAGIGTVVQDGRSAALRRGAATLYDSSRPYLLSFPSSMSELVLQLPRTALGLSESRLREVTARPLAPSAPLRALTALASAATGPRAGASRLLDGRSMADAAISLLRAAIAPVEASDLHDHFGLRVAMIAFIGDHLSDPSLSAELVADRHHISLRLAQQLFAEAGDSVAGHIRMRRLERARALIDAGVSVSAAATRVGFGDPGTFTRAFKRAYGMTPRDYAPS